MEPTIRLLTPAQVAPLHDRLWALAVAAKGSSGYAADFMARFAEETAQELTELARSADGAVPPGRSTVLVAGSAADPIGDAVVSDRGKRAWLDDLWIHPDHQRQGVGAASRVGCCR